MVSIIKKMFFSLRILFTSSLRFLVIKKIWKVYFIFYVFKFLFCAVHAPRKWALRAVLGRGGGTGLAYTLNRCARQDQLFIWRENVGDTATERESELLTAPHLSPPPILTPPLPPLHTPPMLAPPPPQPHPPILTTQSRAPQELMFIQVCCVQYLKMNE